VSVEGRVRLVSSFLHHKIHAVFFFLYVRISRVLYIRLKWLIPQMGFHGNGDELAGSVVALSILNSLVPVDCS
jgi:hypothetical protein